MVGEYVVVAGTRSRLPQDAAIEQFVEAVRDGRRGHVRDLANQGDIAAGTCDRRDLGDRASPLAQARDTRGKDACDRSVERGVAGILAAFENAANRLVEEERVAFTVLVEIARESFSAVAQTFDARHEFADIVFA